MKIIYFIGTLFAVTFFRTFSDKFVKYFPSFLVMIYFVLEFIWVSHPEWLDHIMVACFVSWLFPATVVVLKKFFHFVSNLKNKKNEQIS